MPKVSPNNIRSLDEAWSLDTRNGLPYSGKAVETFIKNNLGHAVGAAWFNQSNFTMYFFRTVEDRDAFVNDNSRTDLIVSTSPINFSSQMYRVYVTNNLPSFDIQAATNQKTLVLSLGFDVQTKSISESSWTSTGNGVNAAAYIDVGGTGAYTLIPGSEQLLLAGTPFELDVRQYIAVGVNRIKITLTDENDDTVTASVVYSVTLAEMYIEPMNNTWYNAIVEGDVTNYKLGGFKIVGSLSKTLHIEIYKGNSMLLHFQKLIGISSYIDTPYNFTQAEGLDLSALLESDVYICKAYLVAGSLTSLPVSYNFMYVTDSERTSAKLVCVNNPAEKAYNYSTARLCDYAIYNAGFSTGDPHMLIQLWSGTTPTTMVDADYHGITTGMTHALEYTIEWLTEATINLFVYFQISMGASSQVRSIPIDNSSVYPAESGADFYMNATTRSNNDTNRTDIINEARNPAQAIPAIWENMSWVDGIDGWTTDEEGRKALLVPAGAKCTIPYQVFAGENMSMEICFRVANVSDYGENIITAADNPLMDGFQGLRIRPTRYTVHSGADIDASKDTLRGKAFTDEQTHHLLLTIQNSFGGNAGKNLVTAYLNGSKNLQFSYANGTAWENNGGLVIGSSSADVYVYFCRVYRKVLGVKAAEQNYINSLRTLQERASAYAWFNSVLNSNTHELLYEQVVNSRYNYNFFVVEMKDGASVPSRANNWSKDTKGYSDLEMHFGEHPEWDFKIFGVETSGQGTTSMDYYRWNLRWRIDKTSGKMVPVAYYDTPTTGVDGKKQYNILPASQSKTVYFDGGAGGSVQNHPAVMRITAKINQASSMQSHKIGATRAYNDLHDALGLRNEAQAYAEANNLPMPAVAVYQYPAFGFSRKVSAQGVETYEFIGLFTIGPDKGDKPTFGYNLTDAIKQSLITLEGTDHSRRLAKFQYPWNSQVEYRASNECLNIVVGNNQFDNAWEVGNCHGLSTDETSDQAGIQTVLESEFRPAYEVVWNNSTLIFPVSLGDADYGGASAAEVLQNINADAEAFRAAAYNDRFGHADMEFWIEGEYVLYHFDMVTGQYVPGMDLAAQNGYPEGSTLEEQNEWFKARRRERFLALAPDYWDIQDSAYDMAFLMIVGATDNFAKNSYPYKMATLSEGGRWKWRQDDLDTILDTDNRGSDSKEYYIEFGDAKNGSVVFAGSTSVFWNLMYEVFWNDYGTSKGIETIGRETVQAMASLGGGANVYSGIINFFKHYFWDNAQNYFPQSAYNVDAAWKYETAWLTNGQAVDPLSQSLGRHLEAEHLWCARRTVYVMSLFKVGAFAQYSDTSLGQIAFRPQSLASITVTPMMWVYPALANGAGSPENTARTPEGEPYTFVGPFGTDGQTTFYIQASNYLRSVGDWKDLRLAAQYVDNVNIVGAKIRTFKIGDELEPVTTNVPSLSFSNTKCLEELDARNAASITGTMDLSVCTRIRRVYLEGTSITQVTLPSGSKIEKLHLPDTTNTLLLKNLKFLTDLQLPADVSGIRTLQIENCTHQDVFAILRQLFNASDAALQYIRLIFATQEPATAGDVTMLSDIAQDKRNDGTAMEYRGINAQGNIEGKPVIEGQIQLTTGMFMDDLDPLGVTQIEDYGEGLKRALSSTFGTLYIVYDPALIYIRFADPEVERIALANWGDGTGVTMSAAEAVTSIGTQFSGNTLIESFDELRHFTALTTIADGAFINDSNLKNIYLSPSITKLGINAFRSCENLSIEINLPNLTSIGLGAFYSTSIKKILSLGEITRLYCQNVNNNYSYGCFQECKSLTDVVLPETLSVIDAVVFYNCIALNNINLPQSITSIGNSAFFRVPAALELNLPNLTTLGAAAFKETGIKKIVSLGRITTIYTIMSSGNDSAGTFQNCANLTDVILPNTLTTIGNISFAGCTSLRNIILSESIVSIGRNAFGGCPIEIEINLPNLTTLGYCAFRLTKISKIVSLGRITTIGSFSASGNWRQGAFEGCTSLIEATLPNTLTNINPIAFIGCTALTTVVCLATTPPTLGHTNAFSGCTALESIYVPYSEDHSVLEAYQSATNWSAYASIIKELDENGNIPE